MASTAGLPGAIDADEGVPKPSVPDPQATATASADATPSPRPARQSVVRPAATTASSDCVAVTSTNPAETKSKRAFAVPVIPMIIGVVALVCFGWNVVLLALNLAPNATVNRIMNTEEFDHGTFWLLVDPPQSLLAMAAVSLGPVAIAYALVLVSIIAGVFKGAPQVNSLETTAPLPRRSRTASVDAIKRKVVASIEQAADGVRTNSRLSTAGKLVVDLTRSDSAARKMVNVWIKLADLAVQAVLLVQLMERGLPLGLVGLFAAIVSINAIASAILMLVPRHWPSAPIAIAHATLDTIFDFMVAIGHPMLVVIYCLATFSFDRDILAINNAVFPIGAFQTQASVLADRVQVAVILEALYALRIYSVLRLFTCLGSNFALCHRLHQLLVIWQSYRSAGTRKRPPMIESYPRRHPIAVVFVLFAFAIVVLVEESVRTSTSACSYHPECSVHAWRWTMIEQPNDGHDLHLRQCPCITLIDTETAPKTFAEWERPTNVTDKVAQLSATGDLRTLQLINRMLPTLPDEMRRCKQMQHLSLIYSQTSSFPDWAKELTQLEYIHIEGSPFGFLTYLPDDLFAGMSSLTTIHFGFQPALAHLPSFDGLSNLHSLTLAIHLSLRELPAFDSLGNLQSLAIIMNPALDSFPDMAPLASLRSFVTIDRGTFCCNGFWDEENASVSTCDLNNSFCGVHPLWGTPQAECLALNRTEKHMTAATRSVFDRFAFSVCQGEATKPGDLDEAATPTDMLKCNGTMFRECTMEPDNRTGMCYNPRMMPISCDSSVFPMEMRRRQIQQGIGEPCDPEFEAWLGCEARS